MLKTYTLAEVIETQSYTPVQYPSVELELDRRYCYYCHLQYGYYAPVNFSAIAQKRTVTVQELAKDGSLKEVRYGVCTLHARQFGIGFPDIELDE